METEAAVTLNPYVKMLLDAIVPIIITALSVVTTAVLAKFNAYMRSKVHSASFDCASMKLDRLVEDAVREANRTIVAEYKNAASDGKLTRQEGLRIRDMVVDVVKRQLGDKGLIELQGCLGGLDLAVIEDLIRTRIEATLDKLTGSILMLPVVEEPGTPKADPAEAETVPSMPPISLSPDGPARP